MSTTHSAVVTFEHILVPTDFSDTSERALEYAKSLAKQGNSELLLVHVHPPVNLITPPEAAWIDVSELESLQEEQLEQSGAALRSEGYRARTLSFTGALNDELLHAVKQNDVDLVVLGTHGRKGLDRFLLGSDAEALFRHVHCPVLCIGPAVPDLKGRQWSLREVMCGTTLTPSSAEVVAYAHKLAAQQGAELVIVHVKNGARGEETDWLSFEEAFRFYAGEGLGEGTWLRNRLATSAPGITIVDLARQRGSDLVVLGVHPGPSIASHLPPGTAAKVLLESPCPVLTLLDRS